MTGFLGNNTGGSSNLGGSNNTTMSDLTNLKTNNTAKYDQFGLLINTTTTTTTGSTVTVTPDKLDNTNSIDWFVESDVIPVAKTQKYSKIDKGKYLVNEPTDYMDEKKQEKRNIRIKGTSLTLNDLYYDPESTNHWLFIKDLGELCRHMYDDPLRDIIYYRSLSESDQNTWKAIDAFQHKNHLYLFTGPCFTENNLYE